jgi:protein ImuB
MASRRIVSIVLPALACELVRQRVQVDGPFGVVLAALADVGVEASPDHPVEEPGVALLDAVDDEARKYGVRPGQRVAEAAALASRLSVHRVTYAELDAALGRVAEVALGLGTTAALVLDEKATVRSAIGGAPFDTVWLDVTGAAHLVGGEEALLDELVTRLAPLGHRVHAAIADGPRIAQALARFGALAHSVVAAPGEGARALASLPVQALPIDLDAAGFLLRLGVVTVGDLARLPRASLGARLGAQAPLVLELAAGRDAAPLVPWSPPRVLVESTSFEEGVEGAESLLFVLRAMTQRLSTRLSARGEAAARLDVAIPLDRSIAKLRNVADRLDFSVELPAPLAEAADLLRALKAKLERLELAAPAVGLTVELPRIVEARRVQLDLSRGTAVSPDALPALLAELAAEVGAEHVGVLEVVDAHAPEARTRLVPVADPSRRAAPLASTADAPRSLTLAEPTRLLSSGVEIGRLARGLVGLVDRQLYTFDRVDFTLRLEGVGWWTLSPTSRDYARAWLASTAAGQPLGAEAFAYVDRSSGEGVVQGWLE